MIIRRMGCKIKRNNQGTKFDLVKISFNTKPILVGNLFNFFFKVIIILNKNKLNSYISNVFFYEKNNIYAIKLLSGMKFNVVLICVLLF